MVRVEEIAQAALFSDSLQTRSLTHDFLREQKDLHNLPRPETQDERVLALAAGLTEMFASRRDQSARRYSQRPGERAFWQPWHRADGESESAAHYCGYVDGSCEQHDFDHRLA